MRVLIIIVGLLFLNINHSLAQLRVEVQSAEYIDLSTIRVVASIQNLGSTGMAFIPYGNMAINIDPNNYPRQIDLLLQYRPVGEQNFRKKLPSSVLIKTWFGTNIEAEMMQEIRPTGTTNHYVWEIIFSVPQNALDVSLDIFGIRKTFQDRKAVVMREETQQNQAQVLFEEGNEFFEESRYSEAISKYAQAIRNNEDVLPEIASNYSEAFFKVGNENYQNDNYREASENFLEAYDIASRFNLDSQTKISRKIGETYVALGDQEFEEDSYANAKFFYQEAQSLNFDYQLTNNKINKVDRLKRNSTTATFLSLVPGGGQFYNRKYTEGTLFLAGGILCGAAAISYSNSDNSGSGANYQQEANYGLYFYVVLSVWSMFRASDQARDFNESLNNYNSGLNRFKVAVVPTDQSLNLALKINF